MSGTPRRAVVDRPASSDGDKVEHGDPRLIFEDDRVSERLSGRRTCRQRGRLWHTLFAPPARSDVCDRCGGRLFQRDDDSLERITAGLLSYRPATAPTLDHYRTLGKLRPVDGTLPVAKIVAAALT